MLDESPRTHNKGIRSMRIPFTLLATSLAGLPSPAETSPGSIKDIVYARVDGHELKLDLHLPGDKKKPPLAVGLQGQPSTSLPPQPWVRHRQRGLPPVSRGKVPCADP